MPRRSRAAIVKAGVAAGVVSGVPSTAWALATGRDPLEAARAAGTLVPGFRRRGGLVPGLVAHAAITAVWTAVLAAILPRSRTVPGGAVSGAVAGVAIAAVDLRVVARRVPAIRTLPQRPQWADHVAFGAVVGVVLAAGSPNRRRDAPAPRSRYSHPRL